MPITYSDTKSFAPEALQRLFLSVNWSSGHYPDKLARAIQGSDTVYTASDGDKLVGLINVLDDGEMTAYVHYLLVDPGHHKQGIGRELVRRVKETYADYLRIVLVADNNQLSFYRHCGFVLDKDSTPAYINAL